MTTADTDALTEKIRDEVAGITIGSGYYSTSIGVDEASEVAAAVLPIVAGEVRKAKAEAWDEGALKAWSVSTIEVNGQRYYWRKSGEPRNPYTSCGHPNHGGANHDCRPFESGDSDDRR